MTRKTRAATGHREVVRGLRVFGFVDTGRLGLAVKPQSDGVFQEQGQDSGDNRRVPQNCEGSYGLAPQLVGATAVEQAGDRRGRLRRRDEADHQGADESTHQVDADDVK